MERISENEYHHAMALYMIARRKQTEVTKLETEMNKILKVENGSLASDAIYTYENKGTEEEFEKAITAMNIGIIFEDK